MDLNSAELLARLKLAERKLAYWQSFSPSPSGSRIYKLFEDGFKGTKIDAAKAVHCSGPAAGKYINAMASAGLVYIHSWRAQPKGPFVEVWKFGEGRTPPRPKPMQPKDKSRKYRARVKSMLGPETSKRVLGAMSGDNRTSTIVAGGVVVWRRGQGINRAGIAINGDRG